MDTDHESEISYLLTIRDGEYYKQNIILSG